MKIVKNNLALQCNLLDYNMDIINEITHLLLFVKVTFRSN